MAVIFKILTIILAGSIVLFFYLMFEFNFGTGIIWYIRAGFLVVFLWVITPVFFSELSSKQVFFRYLGIFIWVCIIATLIAVSV